MSYWKSKSELNFGGMIQPQIKLSGGNIKEVFSATTKKYLMSSLAGAPENMTTHPRVRIMTDSLNDVRK